MEINDFVAAAQDNDGQNAISNAASSVLGKDEFLKLLLTELKYQDAMDPVKDKEFISQMAQFSSLEQTTNLANSFAAFTNTQEKGSAIGMLGQGVLANDPITGDEISGIVTSVRLEKGDPILSILKDNGGVKEVPLSYVSDVSVLIDDGTGDEEAVA